MKLLLVGLALGAFAILVLARLVRIGAGLLPLSRQRVLLWCLAAAGAVLLLFRPHEDFFGGQDQGAYANAAVTYARRQTLSYQDPLLVRVPEKDRADFFYGDELFPNTKYMCFWVKDVGKALIGTWFQPAYPVLMSAVASLGPDTWVLYVTPLFTLFTAVALWVLAGLLLEDKWAGAAAFVFYLLNPVTAWHGRGARAEAVASFFFFAGCALLVRAWLTRRQPARGDILAGSVCLSLSPFFHVSAWLAVAPLAAILGIVILCGHPRFLVYPVAALAGVAGFLLQTRFITDSYELSGVFDLLFRRPAAGSAAALSGLALLAVVSASRARRRKRDPREDAGTEGRRGFLAVASIALAVLTAAALCLACLRVCSAPGNTIAPRGLRLIGMTEVKALATALSVPMALAGLAGWCVLMVRPGATQPLRILLALALLPPLLLAGRIPILMYFLRRTFAFMVPAYALGLASLPALIPPVRDGWKRRAAPALVTVLALFGIWNRTVFFTMTDYRGLASFLRGFADTIRQDRAILLCEYSRIAAPFEHLFGIPTLGLDNERCFDYGPALAAWESILRDNPWQTAFFMTPFGPPISDRFEFRPVSSRTFATRFLRSEGGRLPDRIRNPPLRLSLYRVSLADSNSFAQAASFPYVRAFDETSVGLKSFHAGRRRSWEIKGIRLSPGDVCRLAMPAPRPGAELLLIFRSAEAAPPAPAVQIDALRPGAPRWLNLGEHWWLYRALAGDYRQGSALSLSADHEVLLTAALVVGDTGTESIALTGDRLAGEQAELFARWARARAEVLVPGLPRGKGCLLMLINPCHPDEHKNLTLEVSAAGRPVPLLSTRMATEGWQWYACRTGGGPPAAGREWLRLTTSPPWNPGQYGYPRDLGIMLQTLVLLPPLDKPDGPLGTNPGAHDGI